MHPTADHPRTEIRKADAEPAGSEPFAEADIANLPMLAWTVQFGGRAVDQYLKSQLLQATREALDSFRGEVGNQAELRRALTRELGRVIRGPFIGDEERFVGIALRPETRRLSELNPQGDDLARLNRLLLEDAFPEGLSRGRGSWWRRKIAAHWLGSVVVSSIVGVLLVILGYWWFVASVVNGPVVTATPEALDRGETRESSANLPNPHLKSAAPGADLGTNATRTKEVATGGTAAPPDIARPDRSWVTQSSQVSSLRGQFGDMFGGLTAVFTAFAFIGVVVALLLQREDLKKQGEALRQQQHALDLQCVELGLMEESVAKQTKAAVEAAAVQREAIVLTQRAMAAQTRLAAQAALLQGLTTMMASRRATLAQAEHDLDLPTKTAEAWVQELPQLEDEVERLVKDVRDGLHHAADQV